MYGAAASSTSAMMWASSRTIMLRQTVVRVFAGSDTVGRVPGTREPAE